VTFGMHLQPSSVLTRNSLSRELDGRFSLKTNSHSFRLDGKLAVVTGAGSGIGRAVALRFADSGARVRLLDIDQKAGESVASEISAKGGNAKAYTCDVTQQQDVNSAFQKIAKEEHIDILVNNAGISHIGNLQNTSEEDFDRVFSVNVKGMYNCMCAAVPQMMSNGGGIVLNMASIAGTAGQRLPRSQHPLQLHLASSSAHALCRWFSSPELSGPREGNVRKTGKIAAHWQNGKARGDCGAGTVPLLRRSILSHRSRLSDRRRVPQPSRLNVGSSNLAAIPPFRHEPSDQRQSCTDKRAAPKE